MPDRQGITDDEVIIGYRLSGIRHQVSGIWQQVSGGNSQLLFFVKY
jgi:CII-binding regulator of phage lambda lysogenization HflD